MQRIDYKRYTICPTSTSTSTSAAPHATDASYFGDFGDGYGVASATSGGFDDTITPDITPLAPPVCAETAAGHQVRGCGVRFRG